MHFNICFEGVSGKRGIFHNGKLAIEVFFLSRPAIDFSYCTDDSELMMIPIQCTDPLNQTWVDGQQPPECEWSWVDQMSGVSKASRH